MPELPEVDHARATLHRWLRGRRVVALRADAGPPIRSPRRLMSDEVVGTIAGTPRRRGKHLLLPFRRDGSFATSLHVHLGMTGRIIVRPAGESAPRWSRLALALDDGRTVYLRDPRRFGTVELSAARRLRELAEVCSLGPDPTHDAWDADVLASRLDGSRRAVKDLLLDQAVVAGLGNIYAAEALFLARIHPARAAASLGRRELKRLATAITDVLRRALADFDRRLRLDGRRLLAGDPEAFLGPLYIEEGAENEMVVYDRAGQPCVRCGHALASMRLAGRSSVYCPQCQR